LQVQGLFVQKRGEWSKAVSMLSSEREEIKRRKVWSLRYKEKGSAREVGMTTLRLFMSGLHPPLCEKIRVASLTAK